MNAKGQKLQDSPLRLALVAVSILGIALIYLFQEKLSVTAWTAVTVNPNVEFIIKKAVRVVLNDSVMLLAIYAWFHDQKVTRLAFGVQMVDTFLLLPVYLILKLTTEGNGEISSPLLSQLHRLIVNPTLMILLIPAIYFQRLKS